MKQIKNIFNNNKKTSSIILGAIIILLVAVVVVNLFFINKDLNSKKIKNEDVYVYFGDEKFNYKGNITLDHEGKITNIKFNNKKVTLYSEPIYYAKKKRVILPVPYSVVNTSIGLQNKVVFYTEIVNIDDDYYLVNDELNYKLNNHFLFDGADMYIFIQTSTVTFGDKEVEISPLSYVNYVFDTKDLYIYNYEKQKIEYYENVDQDVFVSNKNYKVNLSSDNLIYNDKQKLLMKNFDYLKKLK